MMMWLMIALGCAPKSGVRYDNSLFELGSGFAAKEACTCVFVYGHDDDFCRAYVRVSPDVARFKVDRSAKQVKARALGFGLQIARYDGEEKGCTLLD